MASKKIIIKVILAVLCVATLAGGAFTTYKAVQQKPIYDKNIKIVEEYDDLTDNQLFQQAETITPAIQNSLDISKAKADKAAKIAEEANKNRKKFTAASAGLYVFGIAFCAAAIVLPKKKKD